MRFRGIVTSVVLTAVSAVGITSIASGQDPAKPRTDEELDESRVRVELLEMKLAAQKKQLMEALRFLETVELPVRGTAVPEPTNEHSKQRHDEFAVRTQERVKEHQAKYMRTSMELGRARRRVAEVEGRQGRAVEDANQYPREKVEPSQAPRAESDRAKLRARVVKLHTELALRQLDYDAERASLLDLIKTGRDLEANEVASRIIGETQGLDGRNMGTMVGVKKRTVEAYKPLIDRKKEDFAREEAELELKRLELAEIVKQYDQAK